ncbi:GGDEF domain-containing protein [Aestuariispira insulae]|uniref:diguanylate cyclase n=1 Tax=Aestuariispira insulae TaxID=1461337 RepID=A0A3D9HNB2_9PROT|nr:GGDEF domain-containing protein [Aestuariispira insulae]RED50895.1 diguanylate cyclase (GGDEF)-like protein [Aestuariispira insulae]
MEKQLETILISQETDEERNQLRAVTNRLLSSIDPETEPDVAYRKLLESAIRDAASAQEALEKLGRELTRLRRLSVTDEVTGILNRRGFRKALERSLERARRQDESGVLLMIDLDGFKQINDTFGHTAGDLVLASVATLLSRQTRQLDAVSRLGGDEFAVILSGTSKDLGSKKAKQLSDSLNALTVPWRGQSIKVAASVGVEYYGPDTDADVIMHQADVNMYSSKRSETAPMTVRLARMR